MKITFYILANEMARMPWVCRLLDKIQSHSAQSTAPRVFVYLRDLDLQAALDKLLWVWHEQSFLPHGIENTPECMGASIVIGSMPPATGFEVLVNLSPDASLPPNWAAYGRIVEVIEGTPFAKQGARQRWQAYKNTKLPNLSLDSHNIG